MTEKKTIQHHLFTKRRTNPRLTFWLGVIVGMLLMSMAGLSYIGYLYNGGEFVLKQDISNADLIPKEDKYTESIVSDLDIQENIEIGDYDYIYGSEDAPVSLVVYTDYECQLCKLYHSNIIEFVDANKDKVKLVIKNFVLNKKHPQALGAATAAICAGEQDKYYEYASGLFAGQSDICSDFNNELANNLELDIEEFNNCLDKQEIADKIEKDYQEGLAINVSGIPNTVVMLPNGELELIDGNVSVDFLTSLLKKYL